MTNEELAVKAQNGDKQAQEKLWTNVYRLLYSMCNKAYLHYGGDYCSGKGVTLEDFTQESYFAFLKAVQAFKPEKEYKFTSYMNYHLKAAINALLGQKTSKKEPLNYSNSLDVPIVEDENLCLSDIIEDATAQEGILDVENRTYNEKLKIALDEALSTCTERQQCIITLRYYHNKTLNEIGEFIGIHPSYVRTEKGTAMRKLRSGKCLRLLKPFIEDYIDTERYKCKHSVNPEEVVIKQEHFDCMK